MNCKTKMTKDMTKFILRHISQTQQTEEFKTEEMEIMDNLKIY